MKIYMMILAVGCLFYGIQIEAKLSSKEEAELRKAMIDYKKTSDPKKRVAYQKTIDKYAKKYPNDPLVKAKLNEKARFDQGVQKPNVPAAKPAMPAKLQPVKPAIPAKPMPAKPQPVKPITPPDLPPRPLEAYVSVSAESLINKSAAEQDAVFARIPQDPSTYYMRVDYYDKYITALVNQFADEVKNANVTLLFDNNEGNITKEFQVFMPRLKGIIVRAEDVKRKLGIVYQGHGRRNAIDVSWIVYNNTILSNLAKNTQGRYVDERGEMDYFEVFVFDLKKMIYGDKHVLKYNI